MNRFSSTLSMLSHPFSQPFSRPIVLCVGLLAGSLLASFTAAAQEAAKDAGLLAAELVFPLDDRHNHAPGIVEYPNGDLIVSWYRGSGERTADDVVVLGSRKAAGETKWSEPFLMFDEVGFPDCNTCMHLDARGRLWLFWPTVIANSWESCLTRYRYADTLAADGKPQWNGEGLVLLKPDDFSQAGLEAIERLLKEGFPGGIPERTHKVFDEAKKKLPQKLFQRLGWQPRCKPTVLPSGRILLPLYTDTFSFSIMAISDDGGMTWYASKPIFGLGSIQPAVLRRDDGTLIAYMRNNGPGGMTLVSESRDDGISWSVAAPSPDIANAGSGLDGVRLRDGRWVLIANDLPEGRNRLTLLLSDDEGKSWKHRRALEDHATGSYHYPTIIQGKDGNLHAVYSYFVEGGETMKYVKVAPDWITAPR
jgi:predicted neuraminidase